MIAMWPHIMHNHILDFQLYPQHDEVLGNYPFHYFLLQLLSSALDCPICLAFMNFLRTTRVDAMQSLEGIVWSWKIADDKDSLNKLKSTTHNFLLLTKDVRNLLVKYYKNTFYFFYILTIFPNLSIIIFTTKTARPLSEKEATKRVMFFSHHHKRRAAWETFRRGIFFLSSTGPAFLSPRPRS